MQDFEYVLAKTVEDAVHTLSKGIKPVRLLSGGTDLLVQLREGRKQAAVIVDIKGIDEVNQLSWSEQGGLTIGAAVPCWKIAGDSMIVAQYPGLVEAVNLIGGTQIQSRATVGGNLCNASPAADSIPALIVHHAKCIIAGPPGRREIPVEQFCVSPGKNALDVDEMLVAIQLPAKKSGFGAAYLRFIPRNEMDIAVVGAGSSVLMDAEQKNIQSARVALGAVGPTPLLVEEVGLFLAGKEPSEANLREAARIAQSAARPIDDMRGNTPQRKHLSFVLARRTLETAVSRALGKSSNGRTNGHH